MNITDITPSHYEGEHHIKGGKAWLAIDKQMLALEAQQDEIYAQMEAIEEDETKENEYEGLLAEYRKLNSEIGKLRDDLRLLEWAYNNSSTLTKLFALVPDLQFSPKKQD